MTDDLYRRITDALGNAEAPLDSGEIAERIGEPWHRLLAPLVTLKDRGHVRQVGHRWTVTAAGWAERSVRS